MSADNRAEPGTWHAVRVENAKGYGIRLFCLGCAWVHDIMWTGKPEPLWLTDEIQRISRRHEKDAEIAALAPNEAEIMGIIAKSAGQGPRRD